MGQRSISINFVNVAAVESDDAVFCVDRDPVPVTVGQGRGTIGPHRRLRQAANPPHGLFDLYRFQFQLVCIANVLVGQPPQRPKYGQ